MKYLLKSVTILDPTSSFHHQKKDILIEEDTIVKIENSIKDLADIVIEKKDLVVTKGWVDPKARLCDPGEEYKETIESGLDAAAFGGFTHVCSVPSTHPVTDSKSQVEYQLRKAENHLVQLHPYGALTLGMEGDHIAEYYDMQQSGAVAFTDDYHHVSSGILYRSLLYSKDFGGKIVAYSKDPTISKHGVINEGIVAAQTGLKVSPALAEWIDIDRNIQIAGYSGGCLHLTGISTAESVDKIRQAKKDDINITADVQIEHLIFTEDKNLNFDSNYRFEPVLRTEKDRKALWEGLKDGTIDYIVTNHRPCDKEEKDVVFDEASCGVIRLQTAINELMMAPEFDLELVLNILSNRNRQFIQTLEETKIEPLFKADLTVFSANETWNFDKNDTYSCKNSYMFNQTLTGKVIATINNGKIQVKE